MVNVRRVGVFQNALSWVVSREACTIMKRSLVDDCVDTEYLLVNAFVLTVCPEDCAPTSPGPFDWCIQLVAMRKNIMPYIMP